MKQNLDQWVEHLASQLYAITESKDKGGQLYHARNYLRVAYHLQDSEDYFKKSLGYEALEGYHIMLKNAGL